MDAGAGVEPYNCTAEDAGTADVEVDDAAADVPEDTGTLVASPAGVYAVYDTFVYESGASQVNESGYLRIRNEVNTDGLPLWGNCGDEYIVQLNEDGMPKLRISNFYENQIKAGKADGETKEPLVMLTAYTARQAQLLDEHCDILLVGDSLGQVIYGLPSTLQVTLDMMCAHGAAVVRGSYHSVVVVDMPFGAYEGSPQQAFESASRIMAETGCAAVKLEGGEAMAETIGFLSQRGIPVMAHIGLTPQAVNALGGYGARGRSQEEHAKIISDGKAVQEAGAFAVVVEGVVGDLAVGVAQGVVE